MIRSLSITSTLVAAALIAASPASASASSGTTAPANQAGYVAVPKAFHSASVTVRVPTLHCTKKTPDRTVQLGLFAGEVRAGVVRPVSVAVELTCDNGSATYRARYRGNGGGGLKVHRGDVVRLKLDGIHGFDIADKTTGAGVGGSGGQAGPGAGPKAERPVLIGVQWAGPQPTHLRGAFTTALVDHTKLAKVKHHKRSTGIDRVGTLHGGRFRVTFLKALTT